MNTITIGDKVLRILRGLGIVYIALVGIFAIEELQRRERLLGVIANREGEVAALLAGPIGAQAPLATPERRGADPAAALLANPVDSQAPQVPSHRRALADERVRLQGLRVRLVSLILGGTIQRAEGPPGTL